MLPSGDQATVKVRIDVMAMTFNFKECPRRKTGLKKGENGL